MMKNIAVFASGKGTNLQAIMDKVAAGLLKAKLVLVVSDRRASFALKRAARAGIKTLYLDPKTFATKKAYEVCLVGHLRREGVELIVLAGFMRILSPYFIGRYRNKILNIHPALLPAFKGAEAIKNAFRYGVKVTGVTVHLVDEKVDHGPILLQESLAIRATESLAALEKRIHRVEHRIYPEAIALMLSSSCQVRGRKVGLRRR